MDIGSICQQSVITVRHSDDLTAAARLMREKHIGYLVVVEPHIATGGERPIGVLTDRDIVVAVVAGGACRCSHYCYCRANSDCGKEVRKIGAAVH